jgi:N-acetylmuramoyl-L-alanine amidase
MVPKALIEIGNMQNAGDAALDGSPSLRQAPAQAVAKAITEFVGGPA